MPPASAQAEISGQLCHCNRAALPVAVAGGSAGPQSVPPGLHKAHSAASAAVAAVEKLTAGSDAVKKQQQKGGKNKGGKKKTDSEVLESTISFQAPSHLRWSR